MLVYGDPARRISSAAALDEIADALRRRAAMPAGIERHGELVATFISLGELAQGIADSEFHVEAANRCSPAQSAVMSILVTVAQAIERSWGTHFTDDTPLPPDLLEPLARTNLPSEIIVKRPEGYAFYALYPESYLAAAARLGPRPGLRVIGIRSIGTGLAALVAAATGAASPITVRPGGDPFRRAIKLSSALEADLFEDPAAEYAIVDEGPGLSGSSFGSVADHLEANGVAPERIHFFPSHANDLGPMASLRHHARWRQAHRHVVEFDQLILRAADPRHRLEAWVRDLVGAPETPLQDISGGQWRRLGYDSESEWPPCHVQQERRKFLLRAGGATWLLKFVGLGREGAKTLGLARRLHAAGLAPESAGYRHGFLIERWLGTARPLRLQLADRGALVAHLGRYIAFRTRAFPAAPDQGASLAQLFEMARHNAATGLGEAAAAPLDRWRPDLPRLEHRVRRIRTDNRLHVWEWLQMADGRLIKTDAVDHHVAHDLIGCQDAAWDIAGASVEFDLSPDEAGVLCAAVEHATGTPVSRDLLAFCQVAYAAFQLGHWTMAMESLAGFPAEAVRIRAATNRYAKGLAERLRAV
jgi:hypothetical protein